LIIMDDGRARRICRLLGLTITGAVGILARAKREGLTCLFQPNYGLSILPSLDEQQGLLP
jgi:predicted nucleic acid-binding protein